MICPNCGFEHDVDQLGPVCANCGMPVVYEEPPPLEPSAAPAFGGGTGELEWSDEPEQPEQYAAPAPSAPPVEPAVQPASAAGFPANCPHCGAEHSPGKGRFCDSCGMSVVAYAARSTRAKDPDAPVAEENVVKVRCRYCGISAPPPICPACGTNLPDPED
jgi:predicted amidophosphoribosyltransferase